MKSMMHKGLAALSSLAVLLALGACGDRETASETASIDPRSQSSSQVTGQATELSKDEKSDTATMGAAGDTTLGEKIDDAQIVAKIKTEFATDKDISAMAIDVDSKDGMVTLSGTVPNSDAKVRADQIAKGMKDVKSVNNQLEVKAG
jgi:hyperosmotically inducible protein